MFGLGIWEGVFIFGAASLLFGKPIMKKMFRDGKDIAKEFNSLKTEADEPKKIK